MVNKVKNLLKSDTDAFKTASKRAIRKTSKGTDDLISKKNTDRNKISKASRQNSSEPVKNEHDSEIPKKRYISP